MEEAWLRPCPSTSCRTKCWRSRKTWTRCQSSVTQNQCEKVQAWSIRSNIWVRNRCANKLERQTVAMTKRDVVMWFPIMSVRRLTIRCNTVDSEERYSSIEKGRELVGGGGG